MAYLQLVRCKSIYNKDGPHRLTPSSFEDFDAVGDERAVTNPARFFRDHGRDFFVCCADFQQESLVLIRPQEGILIKTSAFFFQALRRHAAEVLVLPFADLAAVAAEVADDVFHITTVFVYHTTRCGSTLLTKALEATSLVHGLSEPDIHVTFLQYLQSQPGLEGDALKMLKDVIGHSNTLFNFTLFQQDPTRTAVCYKTRAEALHVAELLQKGVPGAKTILLYRDVTGTVDSYLHVALKSYWQYWLLTALRLDTQMIRTVPEFVKSDITGDRKLMSAPVTHGLVWFFTCHWLKFMESVCGLAERGSFQIVLRYNELREYKEQMVLKILEDVGIVVEERDVKEKIKTVFGVNSQAGSLLAGRFGATSDSWVGDWEKAVISAVLAHVNYTHVGHPDFLLRGTITEI